VFWQWWERGVSFRRLRSGTVCKWFLKIACVKYQFTAFKSIYQLGVVRFVGTLFIYKLLWLKLDIVT
jgi:hypothetical protein